MANQLAETSGAAHVTREDLVALLNDDLAREYQAVISYVVYSQVLKGAQYMNIAAELEKHAAEELSHALILAEHIRGILVQEQDHQVALASALGVEVPNATRQPAPIDEHSRINAGINAGVNAGVNREMSLERAIQ